VDIGTLTGTIAIEDQLSGVLTTTAAKLKKFSENFDGYRLGAGGQIGIGGKAYVGSEYRYSNYEDGLSRHQVAMTVGTRF